MKKRYYLRGIGVGMIITAIIFSISMLFYKPALSDDEIKAKAAKLGMVESEENKSNSNQTDSSNKSDTSDNSDKSNTSDSSSDSDTSSTSKDSDTTANTTNTDGSKTTTETKTGDAVSDDTSSAKTSGSSASNSSVSFSISGGQSSNIIGAELYKAGIVDNPTSFNKYLESNGYDSAIQPGDYQLQKGSSYEEIAHAITTK